MCHASLELPAFGDLTPVGTVDIVVAAEVDVTRRVDSPSVVGTTRVRRSNYKKDSPR